MSFGKSTGILTWAASCLPPERFVFLFSTGAACSTGAAAFFGADLISGAFLAGGLEAGALLVLFCGAFAEVLAAAFLGASFLMEALTGQLSVKL